jgi:hypothetical protein
MVFRTTATRNMQIGWLAREGLLEELDPAHLRLPTQAWGQGESCPFCAGKRWHPELDNLCAATRADSARFSGSDPARLRNERQGRIDRRRQR